MGDEFFLFTTRNGALEHQMMISRWKLAPNVAITPIDIFQSCFEIILVGDHCFTYEVYGEQTFDIQMDTCSICFDDVPDAAFITVDPCQHKFCFDCIRGCLASAMNNGEFLQTNCPENGCTEPLHDEILESVLSFQDYSRFKQFRALARLRLEPNCRWCPTVNCPAGVVANLGASDFPKLHCADCNADFCYHCSDFWHERMTCEQYVEHKKTLSDRKGMEEEIMQKWLAKNRALPCPKCNALVQKTEGCNHITCPCGGEFCWNCGVEIIPDPAHRSLPLHYESGPCQGKQFTSEFDLPGQLEDVNDGDIPFPYRRRRRGPIRRAIRNIAGGITMPVRGIISLGRRLR